MSVQKLRRLFHGASEDFDVFTRMGDKTTSSLGMGHYLTPRREKADRYGDFVLVFDVDVTNVLDWQDLGEGQRDAIVKVLEQNVPESVAAKYSRSLYEVVPLNKEGLRRVNELQAMTSDYEADAGKAKMLSKREFPDEYSSIDTRKFGVVRWKEFTGLTQATDDQLFGLCQEYAPEIARVLGYSGAAYGDEVAIYSSSLASKVMAYSPSQKSSPFTESLTKSLNSEVPPKSPKSRNNARLIPL